MLSGPLIPATEALSLLDRAVFLDASAGPAAAERFRAAHLPGAIRADLEADLSELGDRAKGGRHPLPPLDRWFARLGDWGVTRSSPVVIYDAAGGGMAAARAWWMLRAIGHPAVLVAVVDGGWQALLEAKAPTESVESIARPLGPYPSRTVRWPVVDADFVERIRNDVSWRLIDARAPERYSGETEPIDPVAGHIPGAQNLYWRSQLEDGRLASLSSVRSRYQALVADVPPERVVCYCGSGVTACHLLLTMEASGFQGAQLYLGSWSEWCRQDRPRAGD
ncbi:MAG: sulfurtransferase [Polyangiales bacterium]